MSQELLQEYLATTKAMRRLKNLRAKAPKKQVQAMRRLKHLRAQPPKKLAVSTS
jgi:hypothetical protein